MFRPETKAEKYAREHPVAAKPAVSTLAQRREAPPSAAEMQRIQQDKIHAAERAAYYKEEARLKEQNMNSQLAAIESGSVDSITVKGLYDNATALYNQGEKLAAAQTFWASLVCGEGRAAYDLYKMFYLGDGISKNVKLASIMAEVWFRLKTRVGSTVQDDRDYIHGDHSNLKSVLEDSQKLMIACYGLKNLFPDGVTNEIIDMQLVSFNDIIKYQCGNMNERGVFGGDNQGLEYYMTHQVEQEVVLAGDDHCCLLL